MQLQFVNYNKSFFWFKLVVSIILISVLFYYLTNVDFKSVALIFKQANFSFIFLSIGTIFLNLFLKSLRLSILCNSKLKILDSYSIESISIFLATITPGRIGDFVKIYLLKDAGLGTNQSIVIYGLLRLLDIGVMTLYAIAFYLLIIANTGLFLFFVLMLISFTVFGFILFYSRKILLFKRLYHYINVVKGKFYIIVISFAIWILEGIYLFALIVSLNNFIPLIDSIGMLSLSSIAGLFTIMPFGLGPTDLTLGYLLNFHNVSNETVVALLILMRFIVIVILGLSSLIIMYLKKLNINTHEKVKKN